MPNPPAELVELRKHMYEGLRLVGQRYVEAREVADLHADATPA